MSNHFVLGCSRDFLEAQLQKEKVKLVGPQTRQLLDLLSPQATIVNTDRLEYNVPHSVRLTAFSVIMKQLQDGRIGFMVLGRAGGNFSIGLMQEIPLNQILSTPLGGSSINVAESLLRADANNRCKVTIKDDGEEVVIPTIYPIGFVRGGLEMTQRYSRNVGVVFPHVIKFNSFMLHEQDEDDFNGVTWMSPEQLKDFRAEDTFDPWSDELIKRIDEFTAFVKSQV